MGKWKFFAAFGKEKMEQAGDALTRAIVEFDPETATEAAIELMEEQVDELAKELAKANQSLQKELQEAEAAKANFNKKVEAANLLTEKAGAATGAKKKSLQESVDKLLNDLEDSRPDVELEVQEANDAQAVVDSIKQTLDMAVEKLKTARRDHKKAQGDMKRAEMAERRAKADEERAKQQAGITQGGDSMSVALGAMREAAAEREASAEAAQTKANLLKPFDAKEDDNIAAVMAELSGEAEKPADAKSRLANISSF